MVDLRKEYFECEIMDLGAGRLLNICTKRLNTKDNTFEEVRMFLREDELKRVVEYCIEKGFLDWDCSECPIP